MTLHPHVVETGGIAALSLILAAGTRVTAAEPKPLPKELLERLPPELRYVPEPIPPERNAVPLLREAAEKATNLVYQPYDALDFIVPGGEFPTGQEGDALREWLDRNERTLELVDRALERSGFEDPKEGITAAARLRFLVLGSAMRFAADRKLDAAMREAWKLARLGQLTWGGEGFVVHWMVGTTLEKLALLILEDLASNPADLREGLEWLLGALASAPDPRAALARTHRRELCAFVLPRLLEAPAKGDIAALAEWLGKSAAIEKPDASIVRAYSAVLEGHPRPFDFDETLPLLVKLFTTRLRNAAVPWKERARTPMPDVEQALAAWPLALVPQIGEVISREGIEEAGLTQEDVLRPAREALAGIANPVGKLTVGTLYAFDRDDSNVSLARRAAELEAERAALRAIAGLRLFAIAKHEEAPSLDALVEEKILPAVPVDPFDGKPLRYSRERGLLWSVGPDAAETGEALADDRGERKDLVWASRVLYPDGPSSRVREWLALAPAEVRFELKPLAPWRNAYPLLALAAKKRVEFKYDESDQDTVIAFDDLIQEQSQFPEDEALAAIEAHLEANADALGLAEEASVRPRLRLPPDLPPEEVGNFLLVMRSFAHLLLARARIAAHGGDVEACVDDLILAMRLAGLLAAADGLLIVHLVGEGFFDLALSGVRWLANEPGASGEHLLRLLPAIPPPSRAREWIAKGLRMELVYFLRGIEKYSDGADVRRIADVLFDGVKGERAMARRSAFEAMLDGHPAPLDRADTVRRLGERFAPILLNTRTAWADRERDDPRAWEEALAAWPAEVRPALTRAVGDGFVGENALPDPIPGQVLAKGRASLAGIKNPVGRVIAYAPIFGGPDSTAFISQALGLAAEIDAARAVLGLRIYFERKGEIAASLDALVESNVLPAVPLDPFTGKPLGYSRERGVLWSAGPDGKNDGTGPIYTEHGGKEDWIWPAPSPRR